MHSFEQRDSRNPHRQGAKWALRARVDGPKLDIEAEMIGHWGTRGVQIYQEVSGRGGELGTTLSCPACFKPSTATGIEPVFGLRSAVGMCLAAVDTRTKLRQSGFLLWTRRHHSLLCLYWVLAGAGAGGGLREAREALHQVGVVGRLSCGRWNCGEFGWAKWQPAKGRLNQLLSWFGWVYSAALW